MKKITLLLALFVAVIAIGQNSRSGNAIVINEIDADQTSTDTEEFIELFSENPNTSLNGLVLVLFNGSSDTSYNAVDLNGFSTDGNGFFIIGTDAIPGVDISLGADNTVQNGADAVALYIDDIANWPNGTAATTTNLLDAVVYGTSDADDTGLLTALGETIQFDENLNGMKDTESIQRQDVSSDLFCTTTPTLRATNACPSCTFAITDTTITCDSETGGVDSVTIEIDYIGGGNEAYTVQITSGGGTVGGDDPTTTAAGTITLTSVSEDTMIELTISSSQCNIVENITTPECLPATDVADIATLRGSAQGLSYTLTGEAILTYQQNFRNQKFIEDATGAILIDDDNDVITSTYAIGDGITGIEGTLNEFNGMLQFVPEADPGAASSTGNAITAQTVSITDLVTNPENYESEYVTITPDVTIDNSMNTEWVTGAEYPLTNGDGSFVFRTTFFDADYIGSTVPTGAVAIAGIITERSGNEYFITARNADDAATTLSIEDATANPFSIFPNPSKNGTINIVSQVSGSKNVIIYNILGKEVINTTLTENQLNIASLSSGVYIVRVSQEGVSSTQKLVVR